MERYCEVCQCYRNADKIQKEETYPVKGEPITINAQVMVCKECGNEVYDHILDSNNLRMAYAKYCKQKGLMDSETIKKIRKKYGLSQRGLSILLGWSPATIARYEVGAIPSTAHNEQLKRFNDDPDYAFSLFQKAKMKLNDLDARRAEKSFEIIKKQSVDLPENNLVDFIENLYSRVANVYKGNVEFTFDKLAHMVVFFAKSSQELVKSKLLKLLFYADFLAFKRFGVSMSGTVYCHNHFGPVPYKHGALLDCLQDLEAIELREYDGPYEGEYVKALINFDETLFSKEELSVLTDVKNRFENYTAAQMSDVSHQEEGYFKTNFKEPISYQYALTLKAI